MKTKILITLSFIATVALFSFKPFNANGLKPGDKVSDFSLKNVDGKNISLANYPTAKGFIVVFTCNTCPFSKLYEDRIINLNTKYSGKGYPVIAINPNDPNASPEDSYDKMIERSKSKNYTFPYLYDENQVVARAFGAERTPHVYIIKKSGNELLVEFIGAIDDNAQDASGAKDKFVEKALDEILAGKSVSNKSVKAVGCSIKWKS